MAEIDDAEYAQLTAARDLLVKMNGNPDSRRSLEAGLKVLNPTLETSDDVAARLAMPYMEKIEGLTKTIEDRFAADEARRSADAEAAQERGLSDKFNYYKSEHNFTDEGIEAVKKLMVDRSIADPDAAVAYFQKLNPAPRQEATAWEPDSWNFDTNAVADTAALMQDPDRWGDMEVSRTLADMRRGNQ